MIQCVSVELRVHEFDSATAWLKDVLALACDDSGKTQLHLPTDCFFKKDSADFTESAMRSLLSIFGKLWTTFCCPAASELKYCRVLHNSQYKPF